MAQNNKIFLNKIFEHNGYKIDTTKGVSRFPIFDENDNEVAGIRLNNVQYINGENVKTHYKARLAIYDVEGNEVFTPEQNRNILELFSKFTISNGIEPTEIVHRKDNEGQWRGGRPAYHYNKKTIGVPKNIEGEFLFITTSPEKIPSIISKSQREELIKHRIEIYGVPVSFLPYSTDSSIKDKILLENNSGEESHLIINDKNDLKNSTFVQNVKYNKEGKEIEVQDVNVNIDNKGNIPVEIHGIDDISGETLAIKYKDNRNQYLDFSNTDKFNFSFVETSNIDNLNKINSKENKEKTDKINALEDRNPSSVRKINKKISEKYENTIKLNELNLYKTLKSFNGDVCNNMRIRHDRKPFDEFYARYDGGAKTFMGDYEKDHKDELKKDSLTKDISI